MGELIVCVVGALFLGLSNCIDLVQSTSCTRHLVIHYATGCVRTMYVMAAG